MIDLSRTLSLVKGGIFDPEKTWRDYLPEAGNWQKTALLLTGPLVVFAAIVAYLLESLTILLADGSVVTVSREQDSELFWANFGGMGLLGVLPLLQR